MNQISYKYMNIININFCKYNKVKYKCNIWMLFINMYVFCMYNEF